MTKRNIVVSFFDYTGVAVRPWAERGFRCFCLDLQHPQGKPRTEHFASGGSISYCHADLSGESSAWDGWTMLLRDHGLTLGERIAMVFGFPPCTDLASSGARHWAGKRSIDPLFQAKAVAMAQRVADFANAFNAPFMIENPRGALSTLWRKPDHSFDPCQFGGYLPTDDVHPIWPEHIPPRDAYTKRTCLWTGNGFIMPSHKSVGPHIVTYLRPDGTSTSGSPQWGKLGGKSMKTKNIRSATPRGFALACCMANATKGE